MNLLGCCCENPVNFDLIQVNIYILSTAFQRYGRPSQRALHRSKTHLLVKSVMLIMYLSPSIFGVCDSYSPPAMG